MSRTASIVAALALSFALSAPLRAANPPTATPTRKPTCGQPVDPELSAAWDQARLGCPTAGASIVWAAWQPFERGWMLWIKRIAGVLLIGVAEYYFIRTGQGL